MTSFKLALVCATLLAAISVANRDLAVPPAQPFWELQGAAPGARKTAAVADWRIEARGNPAASVWSRPADDMGRRRRAGMRSSLPWWWCMLRQVHNATRSDREQRHAKRRRRSRPAREGHANLKVSDLDRSITVLRRASWGLSCGRESAWRRVPRGRRLRSSCRPLNTLRSLGGAPAPDGRTGMHHVAFVDPDRSEPGPRRRRVLAHGVVLVHRSDHGVMRGGLLPRRRRATRPSMILRPAAVRVARGAGRNPGGVRRSARSRRLAGRRRSGEPIVVAG